MLPSALNQAFFRERLTLLDSLEQFRQACPQPYGDFVFTVCDNAAKEVCPFWPGQPLTAHWGVPDPAAARGKAEEIKRAYRGAFMTLERRIVLFFCLPLATIDKLAIKQEIDKIGHK